MTDSPRIRLYEHGNLKGRVYEVSRSVKALPKHFNDKASSCVVEGGTFKVFQHFNFRGKSSVLTPGTYLNSREIGLPNDQLSSLQLLIAQEAPSDSEASDDEAKTPPTMQPADVEVDAGNDDESDAFGDIAAGDDSHLTLRWLHAAIARWSNSGLAEYAYGKKTGKAALVAVVEEIYRFVDSDLLDLEENLVAEVKRMYHRAERALKRVKKIVNGVQGTSAALNGVTAAGGAISMFMPFIGVPLAAGASIGNAVQQAATDKETKKRIRELEAATSDLRRMDIDAMQSIEDFNEALLVLLGNTESASKPVSDAARGFLMALKLALIVDAPSFSGFMDELSAEYAATEEAENFQTKLRELQEMDLGGIVEAQNLSAFWVQQAQALSGVGANMALSLGTVASLRLSSAMKASNPKIGSKAFGDIAKTVVRSDGLKKVGNTGKLLKKTSLTKMVKGCGAFTALFSIASMGFDIASLVKANKKFNRLERTFRTGRSALFADVAEYIDSLQDTQDEFDLD